MDFGVGKAIDLERIVLGNQKKIERLLRMGSNDSEIARLTEEIATLEIEVKEAAVLQEEIEANRKSLERKTQEIAALEMEVSEAAVLQEEIDKANREALEQKAKEIAALQTTVSEAKQRLAVAPFTMIPTAVQPEQLTTSDALDAIEDEIQAKSELAQPLHSVEDSDDDSDEFEELQELVSSALP